MSEAQKVRGKVYTKEDLSKMDQIIKEELASAPYRDTITLQSMEIQKLRAENAALSERLREAEGVIGIVLRVGTIDASSRECLNEYLSKTPKEGG